MSRARSMLRKAFGALAVVALLSGCASSGSMRLFVNPDADMGFYKKVAVVPFANLTAEHFAAERVERQFYTELVIANRFHLVEDGEFRRGLEKTGAMPDAQGQLDVEKVKQAAAALEVNGLIRGTVSEYQMQPTGSSQTPVISFDVEMIDVSTGDIVWRGSTTRRGKGRFPVVGGPGTQTFGRLVEEACREVVDRLDREAF